MWRLIGVQGIYNGRFFSLEKDNIVIGKGSSCSVCLDEDQSMAEVQAEFLLCNGSYVFKDLDSACQTTVNGTVPAGMVTLCHGDMVQIGESVFRIEQSDIPVRASTTPRNEPVRKSVPWRLVTAVLLVVLVIAGVAIPSIMRAKEHQARRSDGMRMAQEVLSSLQSINSALKVGVNHEEYGKKVIETQTKIDVYTSRFGEEEFNNLGKQLAKVQQTYADAGNLWDYKINYDEGNFFTRWAIDDPEAKVKAAALYDMCRERYPQVHELVNEGGAKMSSVWQPISTDTAMQLVWEQASDELSKLKIPDSDRAFQVTHNQ